MFARCLILSCLVLACTGCAGQRLFQAQESEQDRRARQEAAVRSFEQQRDQAQFHSAMNDWQQGNAARCRRQLQMILVRNPDHREARLLLAEVHLENDQPELAIEALLGDEVDGESRGESLFADDADWQHTLGLAYEALGDTRQARDCYLRAAELQPKNELFASSYEAAAEELDHLHRDVHPAGPAQLTIEQSNAPAEMETEVNRAPPEVEPEPTPAVRRKVSVTLPNPIRVAVHEEPVFADVAAPPEAEMPDEIVRTIVARIEVTDPIAHDTHQPPATSHQPLTTSHRPLATDHSSDAIRQAVASLEQGQSAQAAEIARSALREHADSAALCRILGVAEYRRGDYAASQSAFQQALSLDNSNALSYFLMGCTLAKLGQQAAADRHLTKARALDPRF